MDNINNDATYLEKIEHCFNRIENAINNISYEEYCENEDIQESTMFNIIQISEYSKKLSNEYKENHQNVPWTDMYGLRNRIVITGMFY